MTTIVKAAGAAEFLSLVPRLLGCSPTESLVVVPMSRGRTLGAMRVDLPPDDADVDAVASSIVGMVCRIPQADALVAVVYTVASARRGLPGAELVQALRHSSDACGLDVLDAMTVAGDGWGSHLDERMPPGGHPLEEVQPGDDLGDQTSGAGLPPVDPPVTRGVEAALSSLEVALSVLCGIPALGDQADRVDPAALEAACTLDDLPALYERALGWDAAAIGPMRAAVLVWCLNRPSLRDVAIVQFASDRRGGDDALDAQRRWEDGAEYPVDLASIMWGEGPRPDADRLTAALELTRQVAAMAPAEHRAGPLAAAAWLAWALGRSTHAAEYAAAARDIDRLHGLAEIVLSFVASSHLPDWAFHRR